MNTQSTINRQDIKKGSLILVWDGKELVKRKVLSIETKFTGEEYYIIHFKYGTRTTTGGVYFQDIKKVF